MLCLTNDIMYGKVQVSKANAITFAEEMQYNTMSIVEQAMFQIHQKRLCMPFGVFHKAVETTLNASVWTHMFADPELLVKFRKGITEAYELELCKKRK